MLDAHRSPDSARRRLIGLLASVLILIFAGLPASQANAGYDVYHFNPAGEASIITSSPLDDFVHSNGSCMARNPNFQCYIWRSGRGANTMITRGPTATTSLTLPYGYYRACWQMKNLSGSHLDPAPVWVFTTADNGARYLGGELWAVGATPNAAFYCYWFGSGHAMGRVEFKAIMSNPRPNHQVEIFPSYAERYF